MRQRGLLAVALLTAVALLSTGCLFNLFQTAKTVGAGHVALTLGGGLLSLGVGEEAEGLGVTPQARLTVGLAPGVDLGLQTGGLVPLSDGEVGWLGLVADLKVSVLDAPDAAAIAVGLGGGYSVEYVGWGVFGQVFLDSNVRVLPLFFAYQPGLRLGGGVELLHHFAVGLKLPVSEQARILILADFRPPGLASYGAAIEVAF
ncbi:MAG: hypothetical protein AB1778_03060 [Candidatus Bipolaricaulota bacterium]